MTDSRPNLLIFMPDQLRADCVGCFGNPVVQTPNIDALAARGTLFKNAYANHPVCSPSRVNLMTGWYPHTRGHRTLTHLVQPWEPNLLRYLKDGGYNVAWAGNRGDMFAPGVTELSTNFCGWTVKPKQLFSPPNQVPGSKLYDAFYYGYRDVGGICLDFDEAVTQTAEQWLADSPKGPWVLFIPMIFPHLPFEVEDPWYAMYDPKDMPAPISPKVVDGKPRFHQELRDKCGYDRLEASDWAEITRTYYGMISRIDAQFGRIMQAIERIKATDNTAVFFFTDHGEYLGDYGLVEKWPSGLDSCLLQNPMIVAAPGGRQGQVSRTFVEMVDILPTILELADIEPSHTHFGQSFTSLLLDATLPLRDAAFSEGGFHIADVDLFESAMEGQYKNKIELQHEQPLLVGKAIAMRTERYTYVYRLYEQDELYDRQKDPRETWNLVNHPELTDIVSKSREKVLQWLLETSDVIPWEASPRFPEVPNGHHDKFSM